MVGSDLSVKGGMTTVVKSFLEHDFGDDLAIKYISTHKEVRNKPLYFFKQLLKILYIIIFMKIDIIHMHMSERGSFKRKYIVYNISRLFRKRVITHTHGAEFESYYKQSNKRNKKRIRKLLRGSDSIIVLGESWNNIILSIEPSANTVILRNSVSLPTDIAQANNNKSINILYLAVLIERKGILDLIKASKNVIEYLEKNKVKINFIIAGDGELRKKAENLVRSLNISQNFNFLGWINLKEKNDVLLNTDIFVLPSYNEGLPMSILEAMSFGIPILATDVGSISDAVISEENGYLIEAGNIIELERRLIEMISGNKLNDMGMKSRKLTEQYFNIDSYFKDIKTLYYSIISKNGDRIGIK